MLKAMSVLVATERVVAVRALRLRGRAPAGAGVQPLFQAAIRLLPEGIEDRQFGADVEAARELLRGRAGVSRIS